MSLKEALDYSEFILRMDKPPEQKIYEFDEFRLDASHLMLYRGESEISLSPKAVETLLALVERRGEIVSKDELLHAVWPDAIVEESNLFLYLSILRKTLGKQKDGKPFVETLRRRGYRFNGHVELTEKASANRQAHKASDETSHGEHSIETQSGRVYVLKEWLENKGDATASPPPLSQNRGGLGILKTDEVHAGENLTLEAEDVASGQSKKADRPRSFYFGRVPAIALLIVLIGIVSAATFIFRPSRKTETLSTQGDVTITALTTGDDIHWPSISQDGKFVVYHTADDNGQRLMIQPPGQSNPLTILQTTELLLHEKRFLRMANLSISRLVRKTSRSLRFIGYPSLAGR